MNIDISSWALRNRKLVYFFIAVLIAGGLWSAYKMSKLEDPQIRVKQAMVIVTYPGATAAEVELQIADPLEKQIRTVKDVGDITSACYNDLLIMTVELESTVPDGEVEQHWDMLRRKAQAAYAEFPDGASMPMVKDDFDTMFGLFYALTGDGMSYRQLSDYAELIKRELLNVDGVTRVDIYGLPSESIDIELSQSRLNSLGVHPMEVLSTLNGHNQTVYAGYYDTPDQRVQISVGDKLTAVDDIKSLIIQGHEQEQLRLGDIATVTRGIKQPMRNKLLYNGEPALGICIGTKGGMDVIKIGDEVERRIASLEGARFPAGLEMHEVFYQPKCVSNALGTFALNLIESIAVVILVLMIFMGIKSALIIGISLLVTVLGSFVLLYGLDGTMQRVSLGSFILAMGMLVDNAIVIIDGIIVSLRQGKPRGEALTSIGRRTAMPLIGATLIAILSFLPIFLSPDTSGVYVRDLFIVLAVSLLLSWILALVHVPLMADHYLKGLKDKETSKEKKAEAKPYRWLQSALSFSLAHRWGVTLVMVALLGLSVWGYRFIKEGFFPDMDYSQLYIEYKLPEGASAERVQRDLRQMEKIVKDSFPDVTNVTASIGGTPCRYNLVRSIATPSLSYGELIVDFKSSKALNASVDDMQAMLAGIFDDAYVKVKRYNIMFKKYPIEVQFTGSDPQALHQLTDTVMAMMRANPKVQAVTTDWEPQTPTLSIDYDQAMARRSGLTRSNIALTMLAANEGIPVSSYHEGIHPMTMTLRMVDEEGSPIDDLNSISIFGGMPQLGQLLSRDNLIKLKSGRFDPAEVISEATASVPLLQAGDGVKVVWTDPVIMRYNGARSQRAQCSPAPGETTEKARRSVEEMIETIDIPEGCSWGWQGEKYASDRTLKYLFSALPLAVILILAILIALFGDYRKPLIILLSIPFMFIGIVPTMIASGYAFTFVAIVGSLGLAGMMIKNGIVLMDEINLRLQDETKSMKQALIEASKSRLMPVMMASLTTILGMMPLLGDVLFGAMAACIMGGLAVGSVTVLIIIPVLYSLMYRSKK